MVASSVCSEFGFEGVACEINHDDCVGWQCLNGGQCLDQIGFATCACTAAFSGAHCETPKDFCQVQALPCANGQCVNGE